VLTDIRVSKKAIADGGRLPTIAKSYYGGTVRTLPFDVTNREMKGWGYPYEEWPQELKDEYAISGDSERMLLAQAGFPKGFFKTHISRARRRFEPADVVKSYFADCIDNGIQ